MTRGALGKSSPHLVPRIQTLGSVFGKLLRPSSPCVYEMGGQELRED